MRRKLLTLFVFLTLFIFPGVVLADGMVIPPPNWRVYETGQKAVIWFENGQEILILSTAFQGDAADFGWIIPLPSRPKVEKGNDEIFTSLKELTEPKYRIQPMTEDFKVGTLQAPAERAVTVVETKKVDIYDVSVVTSTESMALAKWFRENNYPYPVSQAYILDEYIENSWFFVCAKIDTEKLGQTVQGQLKEGHATPLWLKFKTDKIVYPLKISSITGEFYPKETSEGKLPQSPSEETVPEIPSEAYQVPLRESIGEFMGEILPDSPEKEASITPLRPLPPSYLPSQSKARIEILLYVFDLKKKVEIPGFNVSYAGWVRPKEIEKLAFDDEGNPLLPAQRKMYLTKLSRSMSQSEMTNDLYPRYADKNKAVGRGSSIAVEPWLIGLIFGVPILLEVGFIVWLFKRRQK